MNTKTMIVAATIATSAIVFGGVRVLAQTGQSPGHWQMAAGNGGDGGAAWKINVDTGESFFCYRQNCFHSVVGTPPK